MYTTLHDTDITQNLGNGTDVLPSPVMIESFPKAVLAKAKLINESETNFTNTIHREVWLIVVRRSIHIEGR